MERRVLTLVASLFFFIVFDAQSQKQINKTNYLLFEDQHGVSDSLEIYGIILDRETLKPILESPIINSVKYDETSKKQRKDNYYISSYIFQDRSNITDGTFSLKLEPSKYKFIVSSISYDDVITDWIDFKSKKLYIIVLMNSREGLH